MTIGTVTLVLGGAYRQHVRLPGREDVVPRPEALEERLHGAGGYQGVEFGSTVEDFTNDLKRTKERIEEIEEQALEEFSDSVMTRLDEHDLRVIEGSLTARNTTDILERGASLVPEPGRRSALRDRGEQGQSREIERDTGLSGIVNQ